MLIRESELRETIRRILKEAKGDEGYIRQQMLQGKETTTRMQKKGRLSFVQKRQKEKYKKQLNIIRNIASIDLTKKISYDRLVQQSRKIIKKASEISIDVDTTSSTVELLEELQDELLPLLGDALEEIKDKDEETVEPEQLESILNYREAVNNICNKLISSLNQLALIEDVRRYHPFFYDLGFLYQKEYKKLTDEAWGTIFVYDINNKNVRKDPRKMKADLSDASKNYYLQINVGEDLNDNESARAEWIDHVPTVYQIKKDPKYRRLNLETGFNIESKALEKERSKFTETLDLLFNKRNRFVNLNNFFLAEKEFFIKNKLGNSFIHMDEEVKGHYVYERIETYKKILENYFNSQISHVISEEEAEEMAESDAVQYKKLKEEIEELKAKLEKEDQRFEEPEQYIIASYKYFHLLNEHNKKFKNAEVLIADQGQTFTPEELERYNRDKEERETTRTQRENKIQNEIRRQTDRINKKMDSIRLNFKLSKAQEEKLKDLIIDEFQTEVEENQPALFSLFSINPILAEIYHVANEYGIRINSLASGQETKEFKKLKKGFLKKYNISSLNIVDVHDKYALICNAIPIDRILSYFMSDEATMERYGEETAEGLKIFKDKILKIKTDFIEDKLRFEALELIFQEELKKKAMQSSNKYNSQEEFDEGKKELEAAKLEKEKLYDALYGESGSLKFFSIEDENIEKLKRRIISRKNRLRRDLRNKRMILKQNYSSVSTKSPLNPEISDIIINKYNSQELSEDGEVVKSERCIVLSSEEIASIRKDFEEIDFEFSTDELKKIKKYEEALEKQAAEIERDLAAGDLEVDVLKRRKAYIDEIKKKYDEIKKREYPRKQGNINKARYGFENAVKHFIKEMDALEVAIENSETVKSAIVELQQKTGNKDFVNFFTIFSDYDYDENTGKASRVEKSIQELIKNIENYQRKKDQNIDEAVNSDVELETINRQRKDEREKLKQLYRDRKSGSLYDTKILLVKGNPKNLNVYSARTAISELEEYKQELVEKREEALRTLERNEKLGEIKAIEEILAFEENSSISLDDIQKMSDSEIENADFTTEKDFFYEKVYPFIKHKNYKEIKERYRKYKESLLSILENKLGQDVSSASTEWSIESIIKEFKTYNVSLNDEEKKKVALTSFFNFEDGDLIPVQSLESADLKYAMLQCQKELETLNSVLTDLRRDSTALSLANPSSSMYKMLDSDSESQKKFKATYNSIIRGDFKYEEIVDDINLKINDIATQIEDHKAYIAKVEEERELLYPSYKEVKRIGASIDRTIEELTLLRRYAKTDQIDQIVDRSSYNNEDLEAMVAMSPMELRNHLIDKTKQLNDFRLVKNKDKSGRTIIGPIPANKEAEDFIATKIDLRSFNKREENANYPELFRLKRISSFISIQRKLNQDRQRKKAEENTAVEDFIK